MPTGTPVAFLMRSYFGNVNYPALADGASRFITPLPADSGWRAELHGLQGRFPPRSPQYIEGCAVVAIRGPAAPGTDEDRSESARSPSREGVFRPQIP